MVVKALRDFRTSTLLLLYMILNGKGDLTGWGLHGNGIVFVPFLTAQSKTAVCFKQNIFAIVPVFFVVVLVLLYSKSGGGLEDHIRLC